jgi:hypothetical protein
VLAVSSTKKCLAHSLFWRNASRLYVQFLENTGSLQRMQAKMDACMDTFLICRCLFHPLNKYVHDSMVHQLCLYRFVMYRNESWNYIIITLLYLWIYTCIYLTILTMTAPSILVTTYPFVRRSYVHLRTSLTATSLLTRR